MATNRASTKSGRIYSGLRGPEKGSALQTARFFSVFLMGLAAGIVLTHVLQMPFKAALPAPTYVTVQNGIYQLYGPVVGAIEGLALLAALVTLLLLPRRGASFYLTLSGRSAPRP